MNAYPLFDAYPRLRSLLPVAGLLAAPTPLQRLGDTVYLKRDDLSAPDYGGNKIRKLDLILADAQQRGVQELVAFGYAGSNFVAATAWHARKLGLSTAGFLLPQIDAPYVADNLAVALHTGARLQLRHSSAALGVNVLAHSAACLLRGRGWPLWIPPGGSSPRGVAGFINAALELRAQIDAGQMPAPQRLYIAFSSMGSVAGLALGLHLAGLDTRIIAVQVVGDEHASRAGLARLLARSGAFLGAADPALRGLADAALARVEIRTQFYGGEYARATMASKAAMQRFMRDSGARADSAYTGKALAALYDDLDAGWQGTALYWHTFNAHGLPAGVTPPDPRSVAPALRSYLR